MVGIMGCSPGMGVTHLALALASYTARELRAATAVVELGERGALEQLSPNSEEEGFRRQGIMYYPSVKPEELGLIYSMDHAFIIMDLGPDSALARSELMRCDSRLIIGSLQPWRKAQYCGLIRRMQQTTGNLELYTFLALCEDKVEIKECRRTCRAQVKSIPFIADPFQRKEQYHHFFNSLL